MAILNELYNYGISVLMRSRLHAPVFFKSKISIKSDFSDSFAYETTSVPNFFLNMTLSPFLSPRSRSRNLYIKYEVRLKMDSAVLKT